MSSEIETLAHTTLDALNINGNLNLSGRTIEIGKGGVRHYNRNRVYVRGNGIVTSSEDFLDIYMHSSPRDYSSKINWSSVIADHSTHKVGLHVGKTGWAHFIFEGHFSNTFTGDVLVENNSWFSLNKSESAISIQGNVIVKGKSELHVGRSGQFSRNSTVILDNSALRFFSFEENVKLVFQKMIVEHDSEVSFHGDNHPLAKESMFLDDLLIFDGSSLTIRRWRDDSYSLLLVRKDSEHLQDALSKIKFEGRSEPRASVRDYNSDYWQIIPGVPEPATYEAIFGALGLGLVFWRKRRNGKPPHRGNPMFSR